MSSRNFPQLLISLRGDLIPFLDLYLEKNLSLFSNGVLAQLCTTSSLCSGIVIMVQGWRFIGRTRWCSGQIWISVTSCTVNSMDDITHFYSEDSSDPNHSPSIPLTGQCGLLYMSA